ncbi:MAG: DUF1097 domain-containing protein [Treponema sp.]|jgi:hypothetical protein|nr:DUF1097 domain-containing protein [Treponema sp.]
MKIQKLDISVSVLAGVACLFFFMPNPITVWAVFVGWAWYFSLGAEPKAFAKCIPVMVVAYILASIAIVVVYMTAPNWVIPVAIAVAVTAFILMMFLKIPAFGYSIVGFVSYAVMFGGYFGQGGFGFPFLAYPAPAVPIGNIAVIALWMMMSNLIGMGFGLLSVALANIGKK